MTMNAQLREFYSRQGLTGKHLRSALKHDRRRIRKYVTDHQRNWPRDETYTPEHISEAFAWIDTREGVSYWGARNLYLRGGRAGFYASTN